MDPKLQVSCCCPQLSINLSSFIALGHYTLERSPEVSATLPFSPALIICVTLGRGMLWTLLVI
jgi:hypothetical protein